MNPPFTLNTELFPELEQKFQTGPIEVLPDAQDALNASCGNMYEAMLTAHVSGQWPASTPPYMRFLNDLGLEDDKSVIMSIAKCNGRYWFTGTNRDTNRTTIGAVGEEEYHEAYKTYRLASQSDPIFKSLNT